MARRHNLKIGYQERIADAEFNDSAKLKTRIVTSSRVHALNTLASFNHWYVSRVVEVSARVMNQHEA